MPGIVIVMGSVRRMAFGRPTGMGIWFLVVDLRAWAYMAFGGRSTDMSRPIYMAFGRHYGHRHIAFGISLGLRARACTSFKSM